MRRISPTGRFKKDYNRELRGVYRDSLPLLLTEATAVRDLPLPSRFRDHSLSGNWSDHRDCHLRPDLVLIYRKPDSETLQLVRLGSHSELEL
jgi:mRNA interferase YafQ